MDKYIEELIQLIDYEREEETITMTSEIKYLTAEERELLGHTITNVIGKKLGKEYGLTIIQYGRAYPINTEIKVSDKVIVSKDNPLQSRVTATVIEKGTKYIKLKFDRKVPRWTYKEKIRIDLYVNDITFKRMEDNLKVLTKNSRKALEYHLQKNSPIDNEDDVEVDFFDESLNHSQRIAVKKCLTTRDFFLIHGPFGTGKTRTLTELVKQENKRNSKILVTAESNTAVDNLLEKIIKSGITSIIRLGQLERIDEKNKEYTLSSKISQHPHANKLQSYQDIIEEYKEELNYYTKPSKENRNGLSYNQIKQYASKNKQVRGINKDTIQSMARWIDYTEKIELLYEKVRILEDKIITDVINDCNIIITTNSSAALEIIKNQRFDICIIDEASQTTIPSVLIPISKSDRFILAGDHKQLPPTVMSYKAQKLEETLFESLINKYPHKSQLLDVQYRMNEELMKFSNHEFYENKLKTGENNKNIKLNDFLNDNEEEKIISFIDTSYMENNLEKREDGTNTYINELEAQICLQLVEKYLAKGLKSEDIGIITPYSGQVNLISNQTDIEVKSVDGFQGREKELIIISLVRSNNRKELGFLNDFRRLNVALTRAKRKLIIIGNKNTLETNKTYKKTNKTSHVFLNSR